MTNISKAWTVPVVEIDGELGFELPDEIIDSLNLSPGDTIYWEQKGNGWLLRKKDD